VQARWLLARLGRPGAAGPLLQAVHRSKRFGRACAIAADRTMGNALTHERNEQALKLCKSSGGDCSRCCNRKQKMGKLRGRQSLWRNQRWAQRVISAHRASHWLLAACITLCFVLLSYKKHRRPRAEGESRGATRVAESGVMRSVAQRDRLRSALRGANQAVSAASRMGCSLV
jgi:hypothetical protein